MPSKEIKQVICQLKNYDLDIRDVPDEIKHNKDIVAAERKYGLRQELKRGYDIIHNAFFVEEKIFYKDYLGEIVSRDNRLCFDSFRDFFDYLDGDIYEQACYRYYDFTKERKFLSKHNVDVSRLADRVSFVSETIDDIVPDVTEDERVTFDETEKNKRLILSWINKFNQCVSGKELNNVVDKYDKSKLKETVDVSFFFFIYIFEDLSDKTRFKAIMEYMSTGRYPEYLLINALCSIYPKEDVVSNYDYSGGAKQTNYKHKKRLRDYVERLESGDISFYTKCGFDTKTHFFFEETVGIEKKWPIVSYKRYFESFDELVAYRKGNLRGADLSTALNLEVDFSKYTTDETTKLPLSAIKNLSCKVKKEYQNGKFIVWKDWYSGDCLIKEKKIVFPYFFDFVFFLKGDLSNAFLVFCDGLMNLPIWNDINFSNAKMTSKLCEKFGIEYEHYFLNENFTSFEIPEKNEIEYELAVADTNMELRECEREALSFLGSEEYERNYQRVYYISDIHLMHRLKHAGCKSKNDVRYVIQNIVDEILSEAENLLLIGGDISSDFEIFGLFVKLLQWRLDCKKWGKPTIVLVLGNHELWEHNGKCVDDIVNIYREALKGTEIKLLHNGILYKDSDEKYSQITYEEIMSESTLELRKRLQSTRLVIAGGIGFSGYNNEFNANNGIYRDTLDRSGEIIETEKFEKFYNRILPAISDKNTIIFTHTPKRDWCRDIEPQKGLVYISGHTHKNEFYDDGDYRIYSDNQVGYRNENPRLKSLLMDSEYDCFSDYEDGIYEISNNQYNDFYRGKNILMNFSREVNILYMLKKEGYYCFIHQSKAGSLSILNGGALKKLECKDVKYYFEHMDEVIAYIRKPFDKYMEILKSISGSVQKIGGDGTIHGCIVDIDFFNHVYVNPVDMKITGYWASDIIHKIVFPDVEGLLKQNCPELYENYQKLIEDKHDNLLMPVKRKKNEVGVLPKEYLDTDIYKASREIKKMQKLNSNILSTWYENPMNGNRLSE